MVTSLDTNPIVKCHILHSTIIDDVLDDFGFVDTGEGRCRLPRRCGEDQSTLLPLVELLNATHLS
eukprot:scaffold219_cov119-Skeletonema_dohrnii-CCMP3373.AAC.13